MCGRAVLCPRKCPVSHSFVSTSCPRHRPARIWAHRLGAFLEILNLEPLSSPNMGSDPRPERRACWSSPVSAPQPRASVTGWAGRSGEDEWGGSARHRAALPRGQAGGSPEAPLGAHLPAETPPRSGCRSELARWWSACNVHAQTRPPTGVCGPSAGSCQTVYLSDLGHIRFRREGQEPSRRKLASSV